VKLTIGLMSGTSLDGIDAVLTGFAEDGPALRVLGHAHSALPAALRQTLLALNRSGPDELHRAALAANALAQAQATLVHTLLAQTGHAAGDIAALGSHGQTVRHRPGEFDAWGYTTQLNNGALLAELTGIPVVCDFRSRDLAAGGQGAPLVPAFHAMAFARSASPSAVLNLGGIGNLSLLPAREDPQGALLGFDCGPGNALLDQWAQRHLGQPFDAGGQWAATGQVSGPLLQALLDDPFFTLPPPKSTGRDLFHADWLDQRLVSAGATLPAQDVQATLVEFSAAAATQALLRHAPHGTKHLLVCGGGALNTYLMARLAAQLPGWSVHSTDTAGLPAMQVEGAAFAWLAHACLQGLPGNRPEVTGAKGPRVLGALYPAG
jgi:anhydro-N-acetylmuramic acid kinase